MRSPANVANVSDPRKIKEQEIKIKNAQDTKDFNFKAIVETKEGRDFVWDILSEGGLYRESAHQSGSWTYYNEGKRSLALWVVRRMNRLSPDAYLKMLNEHKGDSNG